MRQRAYSSVNDDVVGVAVLALAFVLAEGASLADQVVTNVADGGPGSLRQAILDAGPGDTIRFDGGLVQQILLTNGELIVGGNLTIIGPGAGGPAGGRLLLSGNTNSRIFHFIGGTNALLNLTVTSGYSGAPGGGILNEASNTLILGQCNVTSNSTAQAGGGIANYGNLSVNNCTFVGNTAGAFGGGIYNSNATLSVTNCTFTGNQSALGGGIYNYGGMETIQNSTLAANLAAGAGGGISSGDNPPAFSSNYLGSTIVAQNQATNNPDLDGSFFSLGYNLIGAFTSGGNFDPTNQDLFGTGASPLDPLLGPLQNNGGPTLTMALLPGSPAIDQGNAGSLVSDQRGWPRKYDYEYPSITNAIGGDGSDIGAFELSPASPLLTLTLSGTNVVLSWPTNAPEFALQSTFTLPPAAHWVTWFGPQFIVGGQFVVTDTLEDGPRFFRLIAPSTNLPMILASTTTLPAAQVATNSAVLRGSVVPSSSNINSWFEYGTNTSYGQTTAAIPVGSSTNTVFLHSSVGGLAPGTLYHCQFVAADSNGTNYGGDLSFTTAPARVLPAVITLNAILVTSNSAVLNGTFHSDYSPMLSWFVLFSVNPPSQNVTPALTMESGLYTYPASLNQPLTGLTPGTTYYFYAAGSNRDGTSSGSTLTFTTPLGSGPMTNLTKAENNLPGTTDWKLTNPVTVGVGTNSGDREWPTLRTHAIEGYASATSINKGDWLTFFVSTTSPTFSLEIFRMGYYGGLGARRMTNANWFGLAGSDQPTPPIQGDGLIECNWQPTYLTGATNGSFQVPLDWVSGIYVAKLTADSGKQSYIIFVVRDDSRSSLYLVQSSVTTYQAYNQWGGRSTYFGVASNSINVAPLSATRVSFDRPYMVGSHYGAAYGNGAGHFFTWEKVPGSAPQEPAAWEYNMVRWLESEGCDVTYCTDLDVHRDPNLLLSHKAFISVGHDEYWSRAARTNVEYARDLGVHLAFFAGNTVWNMVRFDPDSQGNDLRTMVYHKGEIDLANSPPTWGNFGAMHWYPESLVGGTWTGGGDSDLAVTAQCPAWLTDLTALQTGFSLGTHLAGYEVNGFVKTATYDSSQLVPPGTTVAFAGDGDSIVYTARASGATVFSAATVQWSWGLDAFTVDGVPPINPPRSQRVSADVQQVTRNVLRRCLDSTRMAADLADGEYTVQSASAYPQWLICDNQGASNGPVNLYGYQGWTATNNQAVWIIRRYNSLRPPCFGPYKTAPDQWYTIRNKQNGQSLIVGSNGVPDGPVMVAGDANGYFGQAADNLQQMWRIWRYLGNNEQWYLFQNVASGQLLIETNNGALGASVIVHGDNGGWGETEENPQKMWFLTPQ